MKRSAESQTNNPELQYVPYRRLTLKDKEYDKVIEIADHFLETNSENVSITSIRGLVYYLKGDYSKSLSEFEGILVNNPDNIGAHYYTGLNHYRMGNYFWALREWRH